jgi:hypothetical protein
MPKRYPDPIRAIKKELLPPLPVAERQWFAGGESCRTFQNKDKLMQALRQGYSIRMAAAYVGIGYDAAQKWLRDDEELRAMKEHAHGMADIYFFERAKTKADEKSDWQFDRWVMEHHSPDDWGKQSTVTVEHTLNVDALANISNEQLLAARDALGLSGYDDVIEGDYSIARSEPEGS